MIKGCVRKHMLQNLPVGAQVEVIAKFSKHRFDIRRICHKVKDLSCKKMLVRFGCIQEKVSYFNLTCDDIERAAEVIKVMTEEAKANELPF